MRYIIEWSDTSTHRAELTLDDKTLAARAMQSAQLRALFTGTLREPTEDEVVAMIQANAHLRVVLLQTIVVPQHVANTQDPPKP